MKQKNLEIGMQVQVKETLSITNWGAYKGEVATVHEIDSNPDAGWGVRLKFNDGIVRWGKVQDIRKVKLATAATE